MGLRLGGREAGKLNRIKQIQQPVDIGFHAQLAAIPRGNRVPRAQVFHLKPVLDVDGDQKMAHGSELRYTVQASGFTVKEKEAERTVHGAGRTVQGSREKDGRWFTVEGARPF